MPDASDEQTWWSDLFTDGADPGLEIPDGIWESVVAGTFEIDSPRSADDLMPADLVATDSTEPEGEWGLHYDDGRHSDSAHTGVDDDEGNPTVYEHHALGHEAFYAADDSAFESNDAVDDDI